MEIYLAEVLRMENQTPLSQPDIAAAIAGMQAHITIISADASLHDEGSFSARADAIDFIDFHLIDRADGLLQQGPYAGLEAVKHDAVQLKHMLEGIDKRLFAQLRQGIRSGIYAGASFRSMLRRYTGCDPAADDVQKGYDNLDLFVNALLCDQPLPGADTTLQPGMVFYQKTPARVVLRLAHLAQLGRGDVFCDVGSGLGQVPMLIHLLTGAIAAGVEYDPALCSYASSCAASLSLANVSFVNADARYAHYTRASVFFMYTPFQGSMLHDMLGVLHLLSLQRTITIFTYGPCSRIVAQQHWLSCIYGNFDDDYSLCGFVSKAG